MAFEWEKVSTQQGGDYAERIPVGVHDVVIKRLLFGSKKGGAFRSREADPQIMLMPLRYGPIAVIVLGLLAATAGAGGGSAANAGPAIASRVDLYQRIVNAYRMAEFADLDKALQEPASAFAALSAEQQADVAYIRQALAECRPAWWLKCREGRKVDIQPVVWGRALKATYDPSGARALQFKFTGKEMTATFSWKPEDMDSMAPQKWGFLMCDETGIIVWDTVGILSGWTAVTPQTLATYTSGPARDRFNLYVNFRANLTVLYYTTPVSRRYAMFMHMSAYIDKYYNDPFATSRRSIAAMLLQKILVAPKAFPSMPLPGSLAPDNAEKSLAVYMKTKMGRTLPWTIAEEKAVREAIKAFAGTNDLNVLRSGKVGLPNGLAFTLTAEDAAERAKRDAWIKAEYDKATAP